MAIANGFTSMTYSTLLLDFDRTLFDSDTSEAEAFADTMRQCGIADAAVHFDTYQRINRTLWSAVEQGHIDPSEVRTTRFERLAAAIGLDANPAAMALTFVLAMGANGDLYPGARKTLEQLAASATLALVTNALSEVQRARIDRLNIGEYFDTIVISTEVGSSKPSPAIFDIAFERLGNPSKQTAVMIGDSLSSDIRGGTNYGIATCWYNPHGNVADPGEHITHQVAALDQLLPLATHTR